MLTPEDVENKVFKRGLRGYDIDDVEDFLQELGEDFETLYRENIRAEKKISMLTEALKQKQETHQDLPNTIPITKVVVKKENKQTNDAETDTVKLQTEAELVRVRGELADITYHYEQMKRSVEVFRAKVVALLNAQLSVIKDYSDVAIDEETVNRAKALLEEALPEAEEKAAESKKESPESLQDTREIPAVSDGNATKIFGSVAPETQE